MKGDRFIDGRNNLHEIPYYYGLATTLKCWKQTEPMTSFGFIQLHMQEAWWKLTYQTTLGQFHMQDGKHERACASILVSLCCCSTTICPQMGRTIPQKIILGQDHCPSFLKGDWPFILSSTSAPPKWRISLSSEQTDNNGTLSSTHVKDNPLLRTSLPLSFIPLQIYSPLWKHWNSKAKLFCFCYTLKTTGLVIKRWIVDRLEFQISFLDI